MGIFSSLFGKKEMPTDNIETLIPTNIEDICYALGCLVGCAAITDPDENLASLFVRLHFNNNTTEIYANSPNWIRNSKNVNDYIKLKVPTNIATFLTKVAFDEGNSSPLTMTIDYITDQYAIEDSIKKVLIYYLINQVCVKSKPTQWEILTPYVLTYL